MNDILGNDQLRRSPFRWLVWGGAAALLLLPLVAMQFTAEVNWDGFDFLVMGGMLLISCVLYEIAAFLARSNAYMVAAGIAVGGAFLTVWANGAVGIIGSEDNPANGIFYGVIAFEFAAAALVRLRARPMAWVSGKRWGNTSRRWRRRSRTPALPPPRRACRYRSPCTLRSAPTSSTCIRLRRVRLSGTPASAISGTSSPMSRRSNAACI